MNLYGPKQLIDSMRTVRKNTILIAEDIPDKDYGYRPTPDSRSVAETLVHIASLARTDRFLHEEDRRSSLENFDFGKGQLGNFAIYGIKTLWNPGSATVNQVPSGADPGAVVIPVLTPLPNLRELVVARQVITPLDLEKDYGLSGGHIHHGEQSLDQLFMFRPLIGWAQYRTPIKNLYLCGSGTHPGGGITGAPGANASREIIRDLK